MSEAQQNECPNLAPCYVCETIGSHGVLKKWSNGEYSVCCNSCYNMTKGYVTPQEAWSAWNDNIFDA
jgi:hypothetical protein